jgi:hypothetical protein
LRFLTRDPRLARDEGRDGMTETKMIIDYQAGKIRSHRSNIQRYAKLLTTPLTDFERQYLQKRISEERDSLELAERVHEANSLGVTLPNAY